MKSTSKLSAVLLLFASMWSSAFAYHFKAADGLPSLKFTDFTMGRKIWVALHSYYGYQTSSFGYWMLLLTSAAFLAGAVYFALESTKKAADKKIQDNYYYLSAVANGVAGTAYFFMWFTIGVYNSTSGREIYFTRFFEWALATPILLFQLLKFLQVDSDKIIQYVAVTVSAFIFGFAASSIEGPGKWILFLIFAGVLAVPLYFLYNEFKTKAAQGSGAAYDRVLKQTTYILAGGLIAIPTIWLLGSGSYILPIDVEIFLYAATDLTMIGAFCYILTQDPAALGQATAPLAAAAADSEA